MISPFSTENQASGAPPQACQASATAAHAEAARFVERMSVRLRTGAWAGTPPPGGGGCVPAPNGG